MSGKTSVFVVGYGNPGRLDDGLGPACGRELERLDLDGVTIDIDYQLNVEHAAEVAEHDTALFVDAAVSGPEPFGLSRLEPAGEVSVSTHSVSPGVVLKMAHEYFGATTDAWVLAIRGYAFDGFGEELSDGALENLRAATDFAADMIRNRNFDTAAGGAQAGAVG